MVADHDQGEAGQVRRQDRVPRPLCHIPEGEVAVPSNLFADILRRIDQSQIELGPCMIEGDCNPCQPQEGCARKTAQGSVLRNQYRQWAVCLDRSGLEATTGCKRVARQAIRSNPQPAARVPHGEFLFERPPNRSGVARHDHDNDIDQGLRRSTRRGRQSSAQRTSS